LVARQHRVRVMSDDSTRSEVERAGARFVPWRLAPNRTTRSRETDPPDWTVPPLEGLRMLASHFMGGLALAQAKDVAAELDREPADLVVNFDMLLGVMAACEARRQKMALLSTCISMFPIPGVPPFGMALAAAKSEGDRAREAIAAAQLQEAFDAGLPALNSARAELGLHPLQHLVEQANTATVRFVGTARAFDIPSNRLPADVRYVGPLIRDPEWVQPWISPWEAEDRRPLVVVGFSTSFQNHAACLQRVIDACAQLPVRVLVTLGGAIRQTELHPSPNVVVVESAPHVEVMRDAAIVVTHGGHGTVMTALMHGVPLLVVPHGRDQGDNAVRVTELRAGLAVQNTASTAQIHAALSELLADAAFRTNARTLSNAIRAEISRSSLIRDLESLAQST
jgi:MGT family glycosyltransferase